MKVIVRSTYGCRTRLQVFLEDRVCKDIERGRSETEILINHFLALAMRRDVGFNSDKRKTKLNTSILVRIVI